MVGSSNRQVRQMHRSKESKNLKIDFQKFDIVKKKKKPNQILTPKCYQSHDLGTFVFFPAITAVFFIIKYYYSYKAL